MEEIQQNQQTELAVQAQNDAVYAPSIWNNDKLLARAYKAATMLSQSFLVPESYRGKPQDCLIAMGMANRMNLEPMMVMQNLYIVKGKPAWSGQFCVALINGSKRFTPLVFVKTDEGNGGVYAKATRVSDGEVCCGTPVTWDMVKGEGWLNKNGSKWATMPEQMFRYRAAAFFARAFCPEMLLGIQTIDEVQDVNGYDDKPKPEKIKVSLGGIENNSVILEEAE